MISNKKKNILIFKLWYESDNNDEFTKKLEEHGIIHYRLDRAIAIPVLAFVCSEVRKWGDEPWCDDALLIYVFSDPASGCMCWDTVVITGYRFGMDDLIINCEPAYSIHDSYGPTIEYALKEVGRNIMFNLADSEKIGCKLCVRGCCIGNIIIEKLAWYCWKILRWLFRKWGGGHV